MKYKAWYPGIKCDILNKDAGVDYYVSYMLDRTNAMFTYDGLPETVPAHMLELYLKCNGFAAFAEYNGSLYVFTGGLGGEPDVYYRPTLFTVANPTLGFSANLKIDDECVLIRNDTMMCGLLPMFTRYATQLVENDISIRSAQINTRMQAVISAQDDRTKQAADLYIKGIEKGELSTIAESAFIEGLKVQPAVSSSAHSLTQLVELQQYLKASWFNDVGLNANYNMKRESLSTTESQMNNDALLPLVDDMLNNRKECLEKVNKKFGTNITVELSSTWKVTQEEISGQPENIDGEEVDPIEND